MSHGILLYKNEFSTNEIPKIKFASLVLISFLQIDSDVIQGSSIDNLSFPEIEFTGCTLLTALGNVRDWL